MNTETQQATQENNAAKGSEANLFLVLEGGGARGVAHVAAWRVLETLVSKPRESLTHLPSDELGPDRFTLTAVAGTSAGAVAAAFIAAGARSGDLIDRDGRVPLRDVLGLEHFHDIFGARGWHRLKAFRRFQKPSARLAIEAKLLSPASERALNRSAESATGEGPTPGDRIDRWDPLPTFTLFVTALFGLWQLLDALGGFKSPAVGVNLFLTFVLLSLIGTWVLRSILRYLEKKKRDKHRRRYSFLFRLFARPVTPVVIAAIVTFLAAILPLVQTWRGQPAAESWYGDFVVEPILYGLAAGIAVIGLFLTLRRAFRGRVRTDLIEEDLNLALYTIMTHRVTRWDEESKCHKWAPKGANSAGEEGQFQVPQQVPLVTFNDLRQATGMELSVIAADTIKNEVCVYSTATHPDFSVARAVAASLAIPFAFRPVQDGSRILVDGGVVSSIPAWVYRRHRTRDPDCRILAIGIVPEEYDTWIPYYFDERDRTLDGWRARGPDRVAREFMGFVGWLAVLRRWPAASFWWPWRFALNIMSTAMFGGRVLELDASDRLDSFSLRPNLRLLDFDVDPEFLKEELSRLERRARVHIENRLWLRRRAFQDVCSRIENDLRQRGRAGRTSYEDGHVRMFWAERDGSAEAVRIKHPYGFDREKHLDDRLVFPFRTSMTAWAMETGLSHFAHDDVLKEMLAAPMNRYRRAVRWSELEWCWAIPIGSDGGGRSRGVLAIESNRPLEYFDPRLGWEGTQRSRRWRDPSTQRLWAEEHIKTVATRSAGSSPMTDKEELWRAWMENDFLQLTTPPPDPRPAGQASASSIPSP